MCRPTGAPWDTAPYTATLFNRFSVQCHVGIYVISKTGTEEYARKTVEKEKHIEDFLEKHVTVLDADVFVIGRQVRTSDKNAIDLMGMDGSGNTVIIELKRGMAAREVVSQILDYAVWAEGAGYDELNSIVKKKHLGKYGDLHGLFLSKFNPVPEPWNENQRLYIVAEQIDEKTREMARYLRMRQVDINCVELNFYEGSGKQIVNVNFVVGDPSDAIDEMGAKASSPTWKDVLESATDANRSAVEDLISAAKDRLKPLVGPQSKYYYMRVSGKDKKNLFGVIVCQKKSAYVSFRVDPDAFGHDESPEIRSGYRWFFTKETERRINLTKPNFELILRCLEHAQDVTVKL